MIGRLFGNAIAAVGDGVLAAGVDGAVGRAVGLGPDGRPAVAAGEGSGPAADGAMIVAPTPATARAVAPAWAASRSVLGSG
ncbi:MAG TPA: hypothetical protein VGL23_22880 [Chloroflexota bacterium]